ncbi:helix-turn-helix domain-containing protein [Escherichia coli]|uniref:helix-turn-helix domain-containing protein n=1 Tax=Escherichia coli TaxID=562 RepID=UPI001FF607E1|nr:helix-turn-helix domain-containing protein [Escherichia coli]
MVEVFHTEVGDPMHKLVLLKLADNANDNGECYPSYHHIAKECEISKRTAMRAVDSLCEKGLLIKQPRYLIGGKEQTSNFYVIVLPSLHGSVTVTPGVVTQSHQGSDTESPGVVSQSHPNQSYITSKENIKNNTLRVLEKDESISEEDRAADLAASRVLDHYNNKFNSKHKEKKYFVNLLKKTKTRGAYTEEDLIMVIDWIAETWSFKPEPIKIARVSRFDEYRAKAEQWRRVTATVNAADVVEEFNITFDGLLPPAELDRDLERKIYAFTDYLKDKSINGFVAYFETFKNTASDFYFGNGFTATLDFLLKPKTLRDTRAGAL